jgi:hypothetical protein
MSTSRPIEQHPDAIDALIISEGLRIWNIHFDKELDLMLIVLSNRKVLQRHISDHQRLAAASDAQRARFELSATGVHWPELDEDLSLRGFLKEELRHTLGPHGLAA